MPKLPTKLKQQATMFNPSYMRRIATVIIIIICFITTSVLGQRQITGKLIDSETKKPIKDAIVKIVGTEMETSSNALGFFQLTVDSLDDLVIDSDGYELAKVQVPKVNNFQIALTKSTGENETYLVVEQTASYPGGMPAFYEYIGKNLRYPDDARKKGISGKIFVEFVIDTTGRIAPEDIRILKGIGKSCDDEVIRVMKGSPRWNPGTQRGKPVRQRMVLPVVFNVEGVTPFYKDFYSFMEKNISYPLEARKFGLEGAVFVDFGVDQMGRVTYFSPTNDIGGGCGEEVVRTLRNVPPELIISLVKKSKSVDFTLPVLFGLEKPFQNDKPVPKTGAFLLQGVNVTAISVSRERPSQRMGTLNSSPIIADDLNRALEKPNATKHLSLTNRGYTSFPLEILKLTKLKYLDLERNLLKGLPREIEKLTELEELYLVENEIQTLPDNFGALKKIRVLGLAMNQLRSFPEAITPLENLEALDLSGNELSVIPPSIGQLKNLRFLVLQENGIKTLPAEFYQLKKLEKIYLKGNPIAQEEIELLKRSFKKAEIVFE